jgi:anti-sigma regulatory factor (Ser/Thr protein kinase)
MGRVLMIGQSDALFDQLCEHVDLRATEVQRCASFPEALDRLRHQPWDVVVTDPAVSVGDSLAVAEEVSLLHRWIRLITLWPAATKQEIIAALRVHVFACFTEPFDYTEVGDMLRAALRTPEWREGIEIVSGLPHWLTLRVACHVMTADRLTNFMSELQQTAVPSEQGDLLIAAFRELLLNAMEHGAGFDPNKIIEVTAAKTDRAIVYHFKDPGPGFDSDDLTHAAMSHSAEDIMTSIRAREQKGLRPGGFGMLIARHVADELVYNERRNEVLLIKHLS